MTTTTIILNQTKDWVPANSGDILSCDVVYGKDLDGYQIEVAGLALENLTVRLVGESGAVKIVAFPADTGAIGGISAKDLIFKRIEILGASAGTYSSRITPL